MKKQDKTKPMKDTESIKQKTFIVELTEKELFQIEASILRARAIQELDAEITQDLAKLFSKLQDIRNEVK